MFPYTFSFVFLWMIHYSSLTKQVMDFQKDLDGWLGEVTLFPSPATKPVDESLGFCPGEVARDVGGSEDGKEQNEVAFLDFGDVSDILDEDAWMDEKIDLSVLDSAQDLFPSVNDADKLMLSDAYTFLESIVQPDLLSDSFPIFNHPAEIADSTESHAFRDDTHSDVSCTTETAASCASVLPELGLQMPDSGLQMPDSPADACSVYSSSALSPASTDGGSDSSEPAFASGSNVFCIEVITDADYSRQATTSKRPSGKDLSLLQKSARAQCQPYSLPQQRKKESKRERKKVQNKEAAARYRVKRREQDKVLADEVAVFEAQQSKLQDQHDKLQTEITYLKSLMREMFKARGILK